MVSLRFGLNCPVPKWSAKHKHESSNSREDWKPEPMELTVWCYPEDADAWDQFVAAHDVPDYQSRFMANGTK